MDGDLSRKVGAAARAAWGTLLIGVVWMSLGYLAWLWILCAQPEWVRVLWGGGDLAWGEVHRITLWFFGVFKILLFAALLSSIWLSLWSRGLRRAV